MNSYASSTVSNIKKGFLLEHWPGINKKTTSLRSSHCYPLMLRLPVTCWGYFSEPRCRDAHTHCHHNNQELSADRCRADRRHPLAELHHAWRTNTWITQPKYLTLWKFKKNIHYNGQIKNTLFRIWGRSVVGVWCQAGVVEHAPPQDQLSVLTLIQYLFYHCINGVACKRSR